MMVLLPLHWRVAGERPNHLEADPRPRRARVSVEVP